QDGNAHGQAPQPGFTPPGQNPYQR
ncbi:zinc-ribbon domain-containing protein, partial [Streptomyces sp. SID7499]|nr:zinc-ribbon domain-containing protein [Streptomyces sp. SID7499]